MRKNTFLFAAALAAVSINAMADEPQKLTFGGDKAKEDSYSVWNSLTKSWTRLLGTTPLPAVWIDNSIAVFDGKGVNPENVTDSIKIDGTINCAGIEITGAKNYLVDVATGSLEGEGSLIKEGTGTFLLNVENNLAGGIIAREGCVGVIGKTPKATYLGKKLTLEGGAISFGDRENEYYNFEAPIEVVEGKTSELRFARRIYLNSKISGSGTLILCSGGDRVNMGKEKEAGNDWSEFTGNIIIKGQDLGYKHEYGSEDNENLGDLNMITLNSTKAYNPEDPATIDSIWAKNKVHIAAGGALGCWAASSGEFPSRCYVIPELTAENESARLTGYCKNTNGAQHFYKIGGSGSDVVFPGTINFVGTAGYNHVGIIKEGKGTYTFTGTKNRITGGIEVLEGRVLVMRADEPYKTGMGWSAKKAYQAIAKEGAVFGGNARISGNALIEGTLQPGGDNVGTLIFADTVATVGATDGKNKYTLELKPTATVEFKLASANSYDKVLTNKARFYVEGDKKPVLLVKLASKYDLKDGESYTILEIDGGIEEGDAYELKYEGFPDNVSFTSEVKTETEKQEVEGEMQDVVVKTKLILTIKGSVEGGKEPDSIDFTDASDKVSVYPNPSNGEFNINGENIESIQVYNNQGQLVMVETAVTKIDLSGMAKGIYFAKIKAGNNVVVKKLVIK